LGGLLVIPEAGLDGLLLEVLRFVFEPRDVKDASGRG